MNCAQFCKLLLCRMGTLSDTAIRPSVCPSVCRSLGYWHVGCLQLAGHQRCADCGASGTVIGGVHIVSRPRGDNLFIVSILCSCRYCDIVGAKLLSDDCQRETARDV